MFSAGIEALSDAELIATLLGTGTRGKDAVAVAREVLATYGGLAALQRALAGDLAALDGLGPAKACALAAALELGRRAQRPPRDRPVLRNAIDVYHHAAPRLAHLSREVFLALCIDAKNRLVREVRIADGGLTTVVVLPREAFAPVLREAVPAVVFVHNHPSGDPEPSSDDVALTRRLSEAGRVLGVRVVDHLVVGHGRYASFVEQGLLPGG